MSLSIQTNDIKNLEREYNGIEDKLIELDQMFKNKMIIQSSLEKEMNLLVDDIDYCRFYSVIEIFTMMPIEVDNDIINQNKKKLMKYYRFESKDQIHAKSRMKISIDGCSTILGLPLLNNGIFDGK